MKRFQLLLIILVTFLLALTSFALSSKVKNSRLYTTKKYDYSQPVYQGWVRTSRYVKASDGVKLAVDIFRPTLKGKVADQPLPVIWTLTCYQRVMPFFVFRFDILHQFPWLQTVLKHGYIVAAVDARGTGASYGIWRGGNSPEEAQDTYDLTEWFASQPWCNGKVGMYGRSYLGNSQYMAASKAPPHLKAIFPEMSMFDQYALLYPGGVFHEDFISVWSRFTKYMNNNAPSVAVDDDPNKKELMEARQEHLSNVDPQIISTLIYRDSILKDTNLQPHILLSPSTYIKEIRESQIPVYILDGWYDGYPKDALLYFKNLPNQCKIVIGPWSHTQNTNFDLAYEHLRWYDYWLKGIDTGIMQEPSIQYYSMNAPKGKEWRTAFQWPLPNTEPTPYYFHAGPTNSIKSVNDGLLDNQAPTTQTGQDHYNVDYSTTTGKASRWANLYNGPFNYPNMAYNDRKGLTFTTSPLSKDIEVTGHPIIHLWVTSSANDGDFFVYLEDVDEKGHSHYITEGSIKASHRLISTPPYEFLGLPFHRSFVQDMADLPEGKPVELVFDLLPTSVVFQAGHRIRVTITCADKDNAMTAVLSPSPKITLFRNNLYASHIILPIIPPVENN